MRTWPALAVAFASSALAASPGVAAVSKPHFAGSYRGTITGHTQSSAEGLAVKADWKVTGLVFRLQRVSSFEGGWTALYKVAAGKVSFSESASGSCSYSVAAGFALRPALPRPNPSAPLALDKDPLGRTSVLGLINVGRTFDTTETCPDPEGGEPTTSPQKVALPTLFDAGESAWRPGRRIHHSYTIRDPHGTRTWTSDLRPGR